MLLTVAATAVVIITVLAMLAFIGRRTLDSYYRENERLFILVRDFHQDLVTYTNSRGGDQGAFRTLSMSTAAAEKALGRDNYVTGVRVGLYMLNNAPLFPIALQEMRREYGDSLGYRDRGGDIADAAQTVLFRHLGRRQTYADELTEQISNFGSCLSVGWTNVTALPLYILSAFGLLNAHRVKTARASLLFRLWNFLVALAALGGPLLAYLADSDKIDAAVKAMLP